MASPLAGAWDLVSDEMEGSATFTDRHYAVITTQNDRPGRSLGELSDSEAAALFRGFVATAGTYDVSNSTWVRHPVAARLPSQVGLEGRMDFTLDGDRLTFTGPTPSTWRRVDGPGTRPNSGAWEVVSDEREGLSVVTDSRAVTITTLRGRSGQPRPTLEPTDAEAAELWRGLGYMNATSYTVDGSRHLVTMILSLHPASVGDQYGFEVAMSGDEMRQRLVDAQGSPVGAEFRYRCID